MTRRGVAIVLSSAIAVLAAFVFIFWFWLLKEKPLETPGLGRARYLTADELRRFQPVSPSRKEEPKANVGGYVLDAFGYPLEDASVRLARILDGVEVEVVAEQKIEGFTFLLKAPKRQHYSVSVESPTWGAVKAPSFRLEEDVHLRFEYKPLSSVAGEFTGAPEYLAIFDRGPRRFVLEGPIVRDRSDFPLKLPISGLTEEREFFVDGLGPGEYRIGGMFRDKTVAYFFAIQKNGEAARVVVEIDPSEYEFLGKAVLEETLEPLADVRISGRVKFHGSTNLPGPIETNSQGEFQFTTQKVVPGAELTFSRGRDFPKAVIVCGNPGPDGRHLVVFPNPPERRAFVVDEREEAAVPYVTVRLSKRKPRRAYSSTSGADGSFTIMQVEPGEYEATVHTGSRQCKVENPIVVDDSNEDVFIRTDISGFIVVSGKTKEGYPAVGYVAVARFRTEETGEPQVVAIAPRSGGSSLYPPTAKSLLDRSHCVLEGVAPGAEVELHLIAPHLGYRRVHFLETEFRQDSPVNVVFAGPPRQVDILVTGESGRPIEDGVGFEIPLVTKAALDIKKGGLRRRTRRGLVDTGKNPFLQPRRLDEPGSYRLLVYPGSVVRISIQTRGSMDIAADELLRNPRVVFRERPASGGD